jgi:hypothetical protein
VQDHSTPYNPNLLHTTAAAAVAHRNFTTFLGQTLLSVHVHCLQDINEAEGIASVHEAFKLGINFFDSSPFYGGTKSETVRCMLQLHLQ